MQELGISAGGGVCNGYYVSAKVARARYLGGAERPGTQSHPWQYGELRGQPGPHEILSQENKLYLLPNFSFLWKLILLSLMGGFGWSPPPPLPSFFGLF